MEATATPLQLLCDLANAAKRIKYPNTPAAFIPKTKYSDRTANGLTKCILDFLQLSGHQAERINRIARPIDTRQEVTDVLGRTRVIGSIQFIKSGGTNGSADISAIMQGRAVKIEIKIGKDKQSSEQKQYQQAVEKAGGTYVIATSFVQFYEWYGTFL